MRWIILLSIGLFSRSPTSWLYWAPYRKSQWRNKNHHLRTGWDTLNVLSQEFVIQTSESYIILKSWTRLHIFFFKKVVLFSSSQVLPRRGSSSWILQITILATGWPWCQTPCPSPVMWRETPLMATRSCVTAGSLPASQGFSPNSSWITESVHYLTFLTVHCRPMREDHYVVRVSVDGVPFPDSSICRGVYKHYHCSFYVCFQQMQHRRLKLQVSNSLSLFSFCSVTLLRLSTIEHLLSTLRVHSAPSLVQLSASETHSMLPSSLNLIINPF